MINGAETHRKTDKKRLDKGKCIREGVSSTLIFGNPAWTPHHTPRKEGEKGERFIMSSWECLNDL